MSPARDQSPATLGTVPAHDPVHALETVGLAKTYGDLVALEPLDLVVPEGQRVVIVGHN
jgi:ABC-type sugar transport system ATPase subunit